MIREIDLMAYLPEYLKEYKELEKTLKAQQPEMQKLAETVECVKNNQFITTADEEGIRKFETMLEVTALDNDTLENRKFRVLSRWNNTIPYTASVLRKRLENLCGKDGYQLEIMHLESKMKVRVALTNKKNYGMVEEMLQEVIPANIWIDLSLLYNQHITLGKFTHRQLAAYTQKEVRNEVLNHGN